jgi:carotenoid cleavage dioxygenase-like enzyme
MNGVSTDGPITTGYQLAEHARVMREIDSGELKLLSGELPGELRGVFLRNSPNPHFWPSGRYHWFDGDGMVHGLYLDGSAARYKNRWIRTPGWQKERGAGRALWTGIMEPVRPVDGVPLKDTANTDLIVHAGKLLALWWMSGTPVELSRKDLSTIGPQTFGGKLSGGMSAHAKVDPRTGELVFFDYSIVRPPFLRYGVISAEGELVRYEPIEIPIPHILHDCAITERYSILLDLPLGWDRAQLAEGKRRIGFDRDTPSRFGILPRLGGAAEIRWFEHDPAYVYHTINAYEDGDEVVLVGCRVADPIPKQRTDRPVARLDFIELTPHLYRWRFNLKTGAVKGEQLDDQVTEFPRVDDRGQGRKLRYSYNPTIAPRAELMFDGFVKYDLERGTSVRHSYPAGQYGSELVFAPRPGAPGGDEGEDDGWLITFLTDAGADRSEAVIFDARNVEVGPICRIALPQRVPIGFHTCWSPA